MPPGGRLLKARDTIDLAGPSMFVEKIPPRQNIDRPADFLSVLWHQIFTYEHKKFIMKVVLIALLILLTYTSNAQSMGRTYRTALGVKVWDGAGISLKHFTSNNHALEGIAYFGSRSVRITGLYEIHGNIEGAPGLKWYIGPGAHIAFYDRRHHGHEDHDDYYDKRDGHAHAGIDGVIGLDYKINKAPINVSLDWQPSFEFGDNRGFVGSWGGLGIRYTF